MWLKSLKLAWLCVTWLLITKPEPMWYNKQFIQIALHLSLLFRFSFKIYGTLVFSCTPWKSAALITFPFGNCTRATILYIYICRKENVSASVEEKHLSRYKSYELFMCVNRKCQRNSCPLHVKSLTPSKTRIHMYTTSEDRRTPIYVQIYVKLT